jgi:hypothetical protein
MRAYTGLGLAGTDRPVAELYDMASGRRVLRLHDRPTDHYTVILRAWFYPHFSWVRVDNDLAELPTGLVPFDNVLFDVRGVVQLRRTEPLGGPWQIRWGRHPARLDGIAVHRPFHRLHECPIEYGEDVRQWWEWRDEPAETSRARIVWRGSNPPAVREGASLRLYLSTWENPRSDVEVQTLDLVSELAGAAPFVIAITVE